ncbi:MAG: cytochrome-c peroxidase [Bryobacterales bacterium]|jgi:cytochrome c peroxidase|nr:cytochrome-c peroxidase [Bryobacterales bacterium]
MLDARCYLFPVLFLVLVSLAPAAEIEERHLRMFAPLPKDMPSAENPFTPEKIDLGRMLYYEKRLSKSHTIACNSCHLLDQYGADGKATSAGFRDKTGDRNSPTVYNAAGHIAQFWDGRAKTVEEQAKGPVMNPVEMAMPSEKFVLEVLKSIPGYRKSFAKAFPGEADPVTFDNFALAVAAFERKLTTPSRWDKFLAGDQRALTEAEKQGFVTFVDTGCATCHNGPYVGGSMFQKLGLVKAWPDRSDLGRAKVTGKAEDELVFKVPSLRNIEKTGPYYHDGKVATLEQAVKLMAEYELGRTISDADTASIVTWLKSLTGEIPWKYIKEPKLPKGSAATPKPDLSE